MPKLSVIVPIYNVELYLDECITSIVNQSFKDIEIILVNDGSPDNCPTMCDSWKERDSRIIVIHQVNKGLSEARNAGIRIAKGDYLAFIDSDDYYMHLDVFKEIVEVIDKTGVDMVEFYSNRNKPYPKNCLKGTDFKKTFTAIVKKGTYRHGAWSKVVKKEIIINNNLLFKPGILCEDFEWTYRLVFHIKTIQIIPKTFIYYRDTPNSIMHNINNKMFLDFYTSLVERYEAINTSDLNSDFKKCLLGSISDAYYSLLYKISFLNSFERKNALSMARNIRYIEKYSSYKKMFLKKVLYQTLGLNLYVFLFLCKRNLKLFISRYFYAR